MDHERVERQLPDRATSERPLSCANPTDPAARGQGLRRQADRRRAATASPVAAAKRVCARATTGALTFAALLLGAVGCGADPVRPDGPSLARSRAAADPAVGPAVELERVGDPAWRPVDVHLFSAPVGTAASGYAEFSTSLFALFPPPAHQPHPDLGVGPGAPHGPPYDREVARGIARNGPANGFVEARAFTTAQFSAGNGVFLAWVNVPDPGVTGSSPDFASGPIIPNGTFPITVSGVATRDGLVFDAALANFAVPPLDERLEPPFAVDGHSHFPLVTATSLDFGPPGTAAAGRYTYTLRLTDRQGDGWVVRAHFVVRAPGGGPRVDRVLALPRAAVQRVTGLEGELLRFRLRDVAGAGPWRIRIDWGDGVVHTPIVTRAGDVTFLRRAPYAAPGTYTLTVRAEDVSGAVSGTETVTLVVP